MLRNSLNFTDQNIQSHSTLDKRYRHVLRSVARHKSVTIAQLLAPNRSRSHTAHSRQLAMYLCHTLIGGSLTDVGRYFGRDRTAVAYACALYEDMRDDVCVDVSIRLLEDEISLALDQHTAQLTGLNKCVTHVTAH